MSTPVLHPFWSSGEAALLIEQASALATRLAGDTLRIVTSLRTAFPAQPAEVVSRAVEIALAQQKAREYGKWTQRGLFTRQSVEQSTAPAIARHHAARFAGCRTVVEICTGAGFDTAALAAVAGRVISIEADAELAALARHNLAVQNIANVDVLVGRAEDVMAQLDMSSVDGIWADPSRRTGDGQRAESPEDYAPPLSFVTNIAQGKRCGIKIAPAANLDSLPVETQREWIGYNGECREQLLWQHAPVVNNTVSIVDCSAVFIPVVNCERSDLVLTTTDSLAGRWLVEPHNAVVRSGVLHSLYAEDSIHLLDEHIAYGICDVQPSTSPLYTSFRILEAFPWNEKKLRQRLRELGWGSGTEIKKRGFPQTPEQLRSRLDLPRKGATGVVVLTRRGDGHLVLLCHRT